ncbi:hypothetical protein FXF51_59655 [Nonomuraea sp. PA05]|uniref:lantibiotic dehydratase C-terminal domain-containing protein n=1 Tax=Nonomuraea sp. PA05 TaxID=2604466 RepID=UPI0011D57976|nr:lantibiotic dehydratase C-terminal domain-containing protein [Nonomuraea sp. PA05]TYB45936.1 hypothetical protein FXF51_59655 [Nonomuraea sp. PA05]
MTAEDRWVSAHLFHFGDLDPLITDVVHPLTRELAADGTVRHSFFLRYWEGGQHVRLRLEVPDRTRAGHVREMISYRAAAHFTTHPSPQVDPAAYRAFATAMARGERRTTYDEHLHPPGSVAFIGYRPEYDAYGDPACVAAAERHFALSSRLALDVLRAGTDLGRRTAIGLAALTIALAVCEPDLPAAARRLATATREASSELEADWRRREPALLAQTRTLWATPHHAGPLLSEWAASLRTLRADLDALHAAGRCAPLDSGSPHAVLAVAAPQARRTVSLILMRCVHLFHNRLGLRAAAEQHTTFLAARAVAGLADPRRWSP